MKNKSRYLILLITVVLLLIGTSVVVGAEESLNGVGEEMIEDESFFGAVYDKISEYASEILCAMTFIGSLILAFAYKKGLLPLVKGSLLSLGNAVSKIKDNAKENVECTSLIGEKIETHLTEAGDTLKSLAERIDALESALGENLGNENAARMQAKEVRLVLDAQIDMLYAIFMSSALPQYQKDEVGERMAKMKEAIRESATEE